MDPLFSAFLLLLRRRRRRRRAEKKKDTSQLSCISTDRDLRNVVTQGVRETVLHPSQFLSLPFLSLLLSPFLIR